MYFLIITNNNSNWHTPTIKVVGFFGYHHDRICNRQAQMSYYHSHQGKCPSLIYNNIFSIHPTPKGSGLSWNVYRNSMIATAYILKNWRTLIRGFWLWKIYSFLRLPFRNSPMEEKTGLEPANRSNSYITISLYFLVSDITNIQHYFE